MEEGKEKVAGMVGTIAFHLIIILSLLFMYLKPTTPKRLPQELGGVPVMFGNVADSYGISEPKGQGNGKSGASEVTSPNVVETPVPMVDPTGIKPKPTVSNSDQPAVTQNFEETAAIKEAKIKAEEQRQADAAERQRRAETERIAQQEAAKKGQINNMMEGAFGSGDGSGSRGGTQGTGTQGDPRGNSNQGKTSGIGGWGSFDLGGRSVGGGGLAKPAYSVDDYGTVVVNIIVDSKGSVIEATIGRGTNTTSAVLKNEALKAARRTKFNTVSSAVNQKGTITYKFNLN